MNKQVIIFVAIFVIGAVIGFYGACFKYHKSYGKVVSGQSEAQSGEIMRGQIKLRDGQWLGAHYMSRDCDPDKPVTIDTTHGTVLYVCVKR